MASYIVGGYDLKEIQHVMAEMMAAIDQVCRKNNIRYILDGGTMLGAIRHKGFIPWDDDLDIAMPRDDYERFMTIANRELGDSYRFECLENTKEYPYNFGKVRAIKTLYAEEFTSKLRINHGIYIDVFPMDYVEPQDEKNLIKIQKMIAHITQIRYAKLGLCKGLKYIPFMVLPLSFYNYMISKFMKHYLKGNCKFVQKLCHFGKNKPPIGISMFTDTIDVPFEEYKFLVPNAYNEFLSGRYGDYMTLPPKDKQKPCHKIGEIRI